MAHKVQIQFPLPPGVQGVELPDHVSYAAGQVVTLSDEDFSRLNPVMFTNGMLTDLGELGPTGDSVTTQASVPTTLTAQSSSTLATAGANTQTGSYVQADVQTIATLANAEKASINLIVADITALYATLNSLITNLTGAGKAIV
jgi:hypothetical protein